MIPNWLLQRAYLTPNRIAIYDETEAISFAELHERTAKRARQLVFLGVKKGDVVAILMKNSAHMVELIHALHYIGAIVLLQNVRLSIDEVKWQLEHSGARFVICDEPFPDERAIEWGEFAKLRERDEKWQTMYNLDDVSTIMYTSGTTGKPKGVMQTYGNHWWSAIGSALNLGLREDDCWLAAVPFFHVSGLSILIRSVIYGIGVYVMSSFDAKRVNELIFQQNITMMSAVSTMVQQMIQELKYPYPPSFRCMLVGGGPVPLPLLQSCAYWNIPVYQTYGMTETASQVATLSPDARHKHGSAGKPLFHMNVRIEKEGKPLNANEVGEIVVKGPSVMKGYWNNEQATAAVLKDGWLYTGDIGYMDDEGFLYVLDRRSDLIISGGENVYPAEIESVLLQHEAVKEAGVVGVADETWGQVPYAFVVLHDVTATEEQLKQFCMNKLAKYKVPKRIYIVDHLPRNAANKLMRHKLKNWINE
ncbi:2-succinylbenzoate--CoA ligase [Anoxybacillus thermarum]|uniref:2-succinylbenzoate--CoA ligase n=1 Tax=Anoxybacillus thermarum TaxID=404937 RepID=A0A0D0RXV6_9BACL|nr:o-succinylbenzoate--CoA ligase [Anoxybacillus thermarum]KIQ94180.1 2-succinylbenzoate--CoA ligase [Anoxybacillus thermarum]